MKIFDKSLILPPLLNIYIDDDDDGDGDGDDDDDALPVVVAVPGKAQAFAECEIIYVCVIIVYDFMFAQIRTFARSLCFSHETALFSHRPHEVCEGLLPQIIVKRAMKQISCRTCGKGPHLVYQHVPTIPARRLEPRMKHVVKPLEKVKYIMSS